MTGELFRDLADPLDHAVVAPDLPGHGRSTNEECSVDEVVESVVDIVRDESPTKLLGYSQGAQPDVWAQLGSLSVPTLVVTGRRDTTYTAIGADLVAAIPDAQQVVIDDAGHHVLGDDPDAAVRSIRSFLDGDG